MKPPGQETGAYSTDVCLQKGLGLTAFILRTEFSIQFFKYAESQIITQLEEVVKITLQEVKFLESVIAFNFPSFLLFLHYCKNCRVLLHD